VFRALRTVVPVAIGVFALGGIVYLFLPRVVIRETPGWQLSTYRIKQIGFAIHNYHDAFRSLPPPAVTGKEGKPLLSWRVLLLPFLEGNELYKQFKLDEPWDSPHNKQFLEKMPPCYDTAWSADAPLTHYRVFFGPGTAFERGGLTWKDFPDGLTNTILVVEANEPIPWTKPEELVYNSAKPLPRLGGRFTKPFFFLGQESGRKPGFSAVFADGTARFITGQPDEETLRALITRHGGKNVDLSHLED
jgi:hypothetical protein